MTGHYLVTGIITPEGCRVEIRDSDDLRYTGRGFTLDDAFADAIRQREEHIERARDEEERQAS